VDAIGATYWNPATISGLERSELGFGLDLLYSNHSISSAIGPASGSTGSENGFFPVPTVGWVHQLADSRLSFGLFMGGVAGFKTTVNVAPDNPLLGALGRISSEGSFMQVAPALSMALNERFSVAAGPVVTLGQLGIEPFVFDAPNADGQYPSGRASRYHWGGGAQVGAYCILGDIHLGATIKTPAWMEEFRFFSEDATGAARIVSADIDLPLILSWGGAYTGFERWELAADIRYFDYAHTAGFGDAAAFDPTGRVEGLGWRSVVALALGAQYQLGESLYVRGGYTYNQSPISDSEVMFNLAAPLFYEHMLSTGASWFVSDNVSVSAAYSYYFPNEVTGPVVFPGVGAIPGASVSQTLDVHILNAGVAVRY